MNACPTCGRAAVPPKRPLGERVQPVKMLLVARGLSQTEVADAVGYRRVTLNLVLNGATRCSAPLRAKLAAYFDVPESALFTY